MKNREIIKTYKSENVANVKSLPITKGNYQCGLGFGKWQHRKLATLAALAVFAYSAFSESAVNDWENLNVNSRNRMPAAAYVLPLVSEQDAFSDAIEVKTPYKLSLNGEWKFNWVGDSSRRPTDFWKTDFNDSRWRVIDVPSCVEMRGYGIPQYTNIRYPHKRAWPKILDREMGTADYNPVSSYRRTFTIPAGWDGREVILRFDGVYSAYYVWVNGNMVGYAEDSHLASEFNITDFVKKDGENLLAVQVFRWCDGSYLEDQDMFRFSGIYRDVSLWSRPKSGIADFVFTSRLDSAYKNAEVSLKLFAYGGDVPVSATLYDANNRKVLDFPKSAAKKTGREIAWSARLDGVNLWSAEKPYLYTLVMKAGGDIRAKKVGFKEQKIIGNTFYVNGKPIKMKGVNRHETDPENGRTVSLDLMIRDIELMKLYNINTVRTCHYPDHHLWYDLCDRYGIYVIAEANVEGHEPRYGENGLGRFKEWEHSIVERNLRQVRFFRNHPSVTMWSMGNETGHGICFQSALKQVKALDPTRVTHWERGSSDADVDSSMYPSVEWLEDRGKLGMAPIGTQHSLGRDQSAAKPYVMCEYAHAMGNAMGNFKEYWDIVYSYDCIIGGCIWDWVDQSVWVATGRVDPKTGVEERYLAYGGNFDEYPNDGPFCNNGIVDPMRNISPKLIETAHVYRNLLVSKDEGGKFRLTNRFCFTAADEYAGSWEIVVDGKNIKKGKFAVPRVAPLSSGFLEIPALEQELAKVDSAKEVFVNFAFSLKNNEIWGKAGWVVARDQVALGTSWWSKNKVALKDVKHTMSINEDTNSVKVECGGTSAVFSKETGTLSKLTLKGVVVFEDPALGVASGPRLTCLRAFVDNDYKVVRPESKKGERTRGIYESGLMRLRHHSEPIVAEGNTVKTVVDVTGFKGAGFRHECDYVFGADGSITMANRVVPYGSMPNVLPRLGLSMRLASGLEQMRYYGRGPMENYIDRLSGSFVGVYVSTVTDQFVDYVRPQDNGYKCDVRWAEFFDSDGRGVRFSADTPLFMQALHYSWDDLNYSRHQNGQVQFRTPLVKRPEVMLNLDVRQLGLGGSSCGPGPMAKYIFNSSETVSWTLRLEPLP